MVAEGGFHQRCSAVHRHRRIPFGGSEPGDTWYGTDEIERQLTLLDDSIDIQGEVFFSYASLESIDGCPAFLTAHYAEDKPVTKPDTDNSGTITQEEAQRQATLLDMLSRFIVSLFR